MGNTEDLGQGNFTWRIRVCSTFHISICINMLPWKLFKSSGIKSSAKKFKFNRKFILWLTWIIVVTTVTITQFFIAFYKKLFFFSWYLCTRFICTFRGIFERALSIFFRYNHGTVKGNEKTNCVTWSCSCQRRK